jgi:hypothetical protein
MSLHSFDSVQVVPCYPLIRLDLPGLGTPPVTLRGSLRNRRQHPTIHVNHCHTFQSPYLARQGFLLLCPRFHLDLFFVQRHGSQGTPDNAGPPLRDDRECNGGGVPIPPLSLAFPFRWCHGSTPSRCRDIAIACRPCGTRRLACAEPPARQRFRYAVLSDAPASAECQGPGSHR